MMMKNLLACAAAMALCASAHASVVTFQYTARIDSITAGITGNDAGTGLASFNLRNGAIASGDIVTGTLSYDTSFVASPTVYDTGSSTLYGGWGSNVVLTARVAASGLTLGGWGPTNYLWVDDANPGLGLQDRLHVHGYSYDWSGSPAQQVVSLSLSGTDTILRNGALPAGEILGFGTKSFSFTFEESLQGRLTTMRAEGNLTSMTLVSSVPEPSTWAMLAAGLALVAWRRQRG